MEAQEQANTKNEETGQGEAATPLSTSCETEGLRAQIEDARESLAALLLEIDDIELQVNPAIVCDYHVKVGVYRSELLRAQIAARRAKRKLALAQAQRNRDQEIHDEVLELQLKAEFEEWEAALAAQVAKVTAAFERRAGSASLSPADANELKRLHRLLVKRLHPDVNVGDEQESAHFLFIAQAAYERGDVELLASLELATRHLGSKSVPLETTQQCQAELMILDTQIEAARAKLDKLKSTEPYTLGEKLQNTVWLTETVQSLKSQIAQQQAAQKSFEQEYARLMQEDGGEW